MAKLKLGEYKRIQIMQFSILHPNSFITYDVHEMKCRIQSTGTIWSNIPLAQLRFQTSWWSDRGKGQEWLSMISIPNLFFLHSPSNQTELIREIKKGKEKKKKRWLPPMALISTLPRSCSFHFLKLSSSYIPKIQQIHRNQNWKKQEKGIKDT